MSIVGTFLLTLLVWFHMYPILYCPYCFNGLIVLVLETGFEPVVAYASGCLRRDST